MRLRAYHDRFDCERFGVEVDDGLVTGRALERHGRLGRGASTHLGITSWLRYEDDWQRRLDRGARRAMRRGSKAIPIGDRRPAAAIPGPGKIVCVGLNYREHVAEGGRKAPTRPLLFGKFANAVVADGEAVIRPPGTRALDLEVELGVVIGRRARRIPAALAMDHVAGYVVVNDISARDWQGTPQALAPGESGDGQWLRAKGSDTFLPMGPVMVTPDEVDPRDGLRLRSWRITPDGIEHPMQDGTTADLVWDIPTLIAFISNAITLEPGDVIATGTPSGVGVFREPPVFLEPGDRVRCEIEGIGTVENPIVEAEATA
ncbi:MAG TPA: fumarylacetoacetate hydrolase family protein [Candidatus Saccharimonadales bacterium]|nr:fumarylacetoacetate hydrolase family protein [Candidatus Saccharimonadales bacterium]